MWARLSSFLNGEQDVDHENYENDIDEEDDYKENGNDNVGQVILLPE